MKIIDFEKRGNVVRFYLGEKTEVWGWTNPDYKVKNKDGKFVTPDWLKPSQKFYGDDWDDFPYECNAGRVYSEFIKGYMDIAFTFNSIVREPEECSYDRSDSGVSKEDMYNRNVPCLVVVPAKTPTVKDDEDFYTFNDIVGRADATRIYLGDDEKTAAQLGTLLAYMKVNGNEQT